MTGQAKISPKISAYYSKPSNQEKLAHTIHQNLLPLMSDCNMAIQDIYTLFIQDDSISDAKKKNLTPLYKPASSRLLFLAKLISFGMERQFIKRNTKNQKLLAGGALSPIVLDYIMDSEVPKPCRHFIGRDKELEELYTWSMDTMHFTRIRFPASSNLQATAFLSVLFSASFTRSCPYGNTTLSIS